MLPAGVKAVDCCCIICSAPVVLTAHEYNMFNRKSYSIPPTDIRSPPANQSGIHIYSSSSSINKLQEMALLLRDIVSIRTCLYYLIRAQLICCSAACCCCCCPCQTIYRFVGLLDIGMIGGLDWRLDIINNYKLERRT